MNSFLLDTHVLIWWLLDNPRLGKAAQNAICTPDNRLFMSAASVWEICIKSRAGKLNLHEALEICIPELLDRGYLPLSIHFRHALAAGNLPLLHNDPFDRMLVAQAQTEDLTLMTADPAIMAYDVRTLDATV
jgi:PIN domain nuclease of toxin-antitoxin system